ncbi:MAG TPA: c-type cytochrome [Anaeromyxobacteraceae bacterium]|nr:c-type cytochrome [Anaeromyxobacteraceae bacterium]
MSGMRRALCISAVAGGILAVVLVVGAGAVLVGGGISARGEPSRLEASIARAVRGWAIPGEVREAANPIPPDRAAIAKGRAHFADHCAGCHANDGSGDAPLGRGLHPRAPDMRARATQDLTDGELFWIIENGIRLTGMPSFGGPGSAEGSWQLVHFVRHLPRLTEEEKAEMEALNPRSPAEWRELQAEEEFLRTGRAPERPAGDAHRH